MYHSDIFVLQAGRIHPGVQSLHRPARNLRNPFDKVQRQGVLTGSFLHWNIDRYRGVAPGQG